MSILSMLLKEAWGRRAGTLLGVATVALVCGLCVASKLLFRADYIDTNNQAKSQQFNMVYLPKDTVLADYYANQCSNLDMPEEYAKKLLETGRLKADHFSVKLERRAEWDGLSVLVTGVRKTVASGGKVPLGFKDSLKPGTVVLGWELARRLEEQKKEKLFDAYDRVRLDESGKPRNISVTVLGREFAVAGRTRKLNPKEDLRVNMDLAEAQSLLGLPGRINAIEALSCICDSRGYDNTVETLAALLPEARLDIPDKPKWMAREQLRSHRERYSLVLQTVLLAVAAALVGMMAYLNVRQRREEIGLLRAVGAGSAKIAALFLGKFVAIGLCGAALGAAAGIGFAVAFGPGIFDLKNVGAMLDPEAWWFAAAVVAAAPVLAAAAAGLPAMHAVYLDPAEALRQE